MGTPHIGAEDGDFAPIVLMPGDPRRARRIAQTFFTDARLVTDIRAIEGWTGTYEGTPISVLASGMGQPSISIYATELFRFFGVARIIRVGTAGALADELQLGDVVIGAAAHTDSSLGARIPGVHFAHTPSYPLLSAAVRASQTAGVAAHVGALFSSDAFYEDRPALFELLGKYGTLAVEMEAAALYGVALAEGREALAVCTVSDHIVRGEKMTAQLRETSFSSMVRVAIGALLS